jgi:hypothetical protein
MFPYDKLQALFAEHNLVTERLGSAVFAQRRFSDVDEFELCLKQLSDRGVDSRGLEAQGLLQADLFVSRPASDVRAAKLDDLVKVGVGRNRATGARYVNVQTLDGPHVALEP